MTAVTEIRLPQYGMGMREGTITAWFKREGDHVAAGEVVAEIEAEKVTEELVATAGGVLQRILVPEGDTVAVNELLAVIVPTGAVEPAVPDDEPAVPDDEPAVPDDEPDVADDERGAVAATDPVADRRDPVPAVPGGGSGRQITPRARRLAADLGIDIDSVIGTGPGGRVSEDDVAAAAAGDPSPASPPSLD